MNWIDFIIIAILAFYALEGIAIGFVRGTFDLLGFVLSFTAALKFYTVAGHLLTQNFSLPHGIANAVGFFVVAIITEVILSTLFTTLLKKVSPQLFKNPLQRALGLLPSLASAAVLIAFFLTLVLALPLSPFLKSAVSDSKIAGYLTRQSAGLERFVNQIFGQAANETINFITVRPGASETVDLRFKVKNLTADFASEQVMLDLVNEERIKMELKPLAFDNRLREVARNHAQDMFTRGYFSHYSPEGASPYDRMASANISFTVAGENLAYAPNVTLAHDGLMKSPGHRANILSANFGKVGIGVIDGGIYGKMFVQEFAD